MSRARAVRSYVFSFQAEDGIRDLTVTGVQTCALPISNVFWDLSGSTLTKMQGRLADFQKIFWWSNTEWQSPEWKAKKPDSDASAFGKIVFGSRSEEHTSELQSQSNLVCRLLLEKKNTH